MRHGLHDHARALGRVAGRIGSANDARLEQRERGSLDRRTEWTVFRRVATVTGDAVGLVNLPTPARVSGPRRPR